MSKDATIERGKFSVPMRSAIIARFTVNVLKLTLYHQLIFLQATE